MIAIFLAAFIHAFGLVVRFALMRLWMWMGFLIGACEINISSCHLNCVLLYGCKRFQLFINTFFEFIWLFFRFAFQQRARLKKLDVVVSSFLQLEHEHEHLTSERRNLWSFVRSIDDNPVRWNMCVCVLKSVVESLAHQIDRNQTKPIHMTAVKHALNALCFGNGQSTKPFQCSLFHSLDI